MTSRRALELACSLQPLWLSRGRIQEGLAWFDAVLADENALPDDRGTPAVRARALADRAVLDAWVERSTTSTTPRRPSRSRANSTIRRCWSGRSLACGSAAVYDAEVAGRYFAEAIGLARELGDRWRLYPDPRPAGSGGVRRRRSHGGARRCRGRTRYRRRHRRPLRVAAVPVAARGRAHLRGRSGRRRSPQMREVVAEAEADHDVISRVTALSHAAARAGLPR